MPQQTPFLPDVSHVLHGRLARCERDRMRERTEQLRPASLGRLCHLFGRWLPADLFAHEPTRRRRNDPLSLTFWAFLYQVLNPGSSCRETARKVQLWHRQRKQTMPSSRTGAYCQARQRLPLDRLDQAHEALADRVASDAATEGTWKGHRLRVVDGTGLSMPDTPSNQKAYPQAKAQAPGCGFPVVKLVAVFCLQTGALIR